MKNPKPGLPKPDMQKPAGKSPRLASGAAQSRKPVEPFWRRGLENLNKKEWESLCDGCGRCCLVKLIDEDTDKIHFTDIACKLFNGDTCQCHDYKNRQKFVRDCVKLTRAKLKTIPWLPPTCAYRMVDEGKDLEWWHPLVSGSPESVHEAGVSVRGKVGAVEGQIRLRDYVDRIVKWPGQSPRAVKKPG